MTELASTTLRLSSTLFELIKNLRRAFKFRQRAQLRANVSPVQFTGLAHDDPFDICPILTTPGEGF
jgi:hypothetical protein